MEDKEFNNGDEVYIGSRFVGVWIGNNPITGSEVVYSEAKNEFGSYHTWQIECYPSVSVKADFKTIQGL